MGKGSGKVRTEHFGARSRQHEGGGESHRQVDMTEDKATA